MSEKVEEKLKLALELQKKFKRKLFYPDEEQWLDEDALLYDTESASNKVASLIAEIQSSAEHFQESAFYLVAKQLFDCRRMLECKVEQKLGPRDDWHSTKELIHPQEPWPQTPYVMRERAEKRAFEELYPVEHLSSLFRFGIDLKADCDSSHFGSAKAAELVYKAISYQLSTTKDALERMGYVFVDHSSGKSEAYDPARSIMLSEDTMCGILQPDPVVVSYVHDSI